MHDVRVAAATQHRRDSCFGDRHAQPHSLTHGMLARSTCIGLVIEPERRAPSGGHHTPGDDRQMVAGSPEKSIRILVFVEKHDVRRGSISGATIANRHDVQPGLVEFEGIRSAGRVGVDEEIDGFGKDERSIHSLMRVGWST